MRTPAIPDLHDPELAARLRRRIDGKTKPPGSLGRLEALAMRIGLVLGTEQPALDAPQLLVCAADHGLAARGVSAYPSDVTWQMVENFLGGGAAVSVLARLHGIALTVADCGVAHDFGGRAVPVDRIDAGAPATRPRFVDCKIAPGTADSSDGPAMLPAQCERAIANGRAVVRALPGNALLLGEMGIGNTSAASLLLSRLARLPIDVCVGAGTGLDAAGVARKTAVLARVLERHAAALDPLDALAAFGGFEIATLVGAVLEAAAARRVIVVDGFITGAAVLVAARLEPRVLERCVHSHRSAEAGHARLLNALEALASPGGPAPEPLLDLGLRLGEGSGAALAWPLLNAACAVLNDMASFESAGVSRGG